jgi:hypothetical protein
MGFDLFFEGCEIADYVFGEDFVGYDYAAHCCSPYGPVKPHLGHLYNRPNLRHLPSRLIWISPQLGQRNFVASVPGAIGLPQLVHVVSDRLVDFSAMTCQLCNAKVIVRLLNICCALLLGKFYSPLI